jgi:hypothetical protein
MLIITPSNLNRRGAFLHRFGRGEARCCGRAAGSQRRSSAAANVPESAAIDAASGFRCSIPGKQETCNFAQRRYLSACVSMVNTAIRHKSLAVSRSSTSHARSLDANHSIINVSLVPPLLSPKPTI